MKARLMRVINARRITMIILALSSVAYFSSCNKSSDVAAYKFSASDTNETKEFKDIATVKRLTTNEAADFECYLETSR